MAGEVQVTHELLSRKELHDAWNWLISRIQARPANPGLLCYFDNKCWDDDPARDDYEEHHARTCLMLGRLYVASQFGDHRSLIGMVHGMPAPEVIWVGRYLDRDSRTVIANVERFRNHLSEHLAFWICLGVENKQRGRAYQPENIEFTYSKPHIQPEDKGPDGLYLEIAPSNRIEIHSVKSSIRNPQSQISSHGFRTLGLANPRDPQGSMPLLDELWWLVYYEDGLIRLDKLVDQCLNSLHTDLQQLLRIGLVTTSAINAVVVANSRYSSERLFGGFQYVKPDITKRFATYIGAVNWQVLAAGTYEVVNQILHDRGIDTE